MKRGDRILLKRGRTRTSCAVIHDHSVDEPGFPAVTIKHNGSEWLVGLNEIVTAEEIEAERKAKLQAAADSVADIVRVFSEGNDTIRKISLALNKQMIDVLSRAKKAERLGLIKLRKEKETKESSAPF